MKKGTRHAMVAQKIMKNIQSGIFAPGQKLPSEIVLAKSLKVSRSTVRLALEHLSRRAVVEKIHGRGTYVKSPSAHAGYVTILAVGPGARHALFVAALIAQCEKHARLLGWKTAITYMDDASEASDIAREIGDDPGAAGGILAGHIDRESAAALAAAAKGKLAMIGDFEEAARAAPIMDQVIGAHYQCVSTAATYLMQNGVRHPALFQEHTPCVWTTETVSAFRSVADAAGIDASRQDIISLPRGWSNAAVKNHEETPADKVIRKQFHDWDVRNDWPDGIIINRDALAFVAACAETDAAAAKALARSRLAVRVFDDHLRMAPPRGQTLNIRWVVYSVTELVALAFSLLQDRGRADNPVRLYAQKCFLM